MASRYRSISRPALNLLKSTITISTSKVNLAIGFSPISASAAHGCLFGSTHLVPRRGHEGLEVAVSGYSNKNLSFGMVDLGLFPNAAEKFGISLVLAGSSDKLPTYILFENGVEITRFPEVDFVAKVFNPPITKQ